MDGSFKKALSKLICTQLNFPSGYVPDVNSIFETTVVNTVVAVLIKWFKNSTFT